MKSEAVQIDLMDPTGITLKGFLHCPEEKKALVIFAHSGSKNEPTRTDIHLARELKRRNIASLAISLLAPVENEVQENKLNITLLSDRLIQVTQWAMQHQSLRLLPLGYFGNDTGAACCLQAAAIMNGDIRSIVSVSGQPALAKHALTKVSAPVQLITGSLDKQSVYLSQIAFDQLRSKKRFITIDGASNSFEEPGALNKVAKCTADWMEEHLIW